MIRWRVKQLVLAVFWKKCVTSSEKIFLLDSLHFPRLELHVQTPFVFLFERGRGFWNFQKNWKPLKVTINSYKCAFQHKSNLFWNIIIWPKSATPLNRPNFIDVWFNPGICFLDYSWAYREEKKPNLCLMFLFFIFDFMQVWCFASFIQRPEPHVESKNIRF